MKQKIDTPLSVGEQYSSIVIDTYSPNDSDCFGKEWSHNDTQCSYCSMQSICMVLTTKKIKTKGDALSQIGFVDEVDFSLVPKNAIANLFHHNSYPIDSLRVLFADYSKCNDPVTVALQVNYFIREYGLTVESGTVKRKV